MAYQIAFSWNEKAAKELEEMGFEKREVYIKTAPHGTTKQSKKKGDAQFFAMENRPHQFCTTSWWGACND